MYVQVTIWLARVVLSGKDWEHSLVALTVTKCIVHVDACNSSTDFTFLGIQGSTFGLCLTYHQRIAKFQKLCALNAN